MAHLCMCEQALAAPGVHDCPHMCTAPVHATCVNAVGMVPFGCTPAHTVIWKLLSPPGREPGKVGEFCSMLLDLIVGTVLNWNEFSRKQKCAGYRIQIQVV